MRYFLFVLLIVGAAAVPVLAQPERPDIRLNIDDPAFDLEGYKIAVQVLRDRDKDPAHHDDPINWKSNGYNYFADLHNVFIGDSGCRHGSELFFSWHRPLLRRFELALQAAQPPRTSKVTIPYWVWTEPASGVSYPKAFEDETSILFARTRTKVLRPDQHFTTDKIVQLIADNPTWAPFGGRACSLLTGCGTQESCVRCPGEGPGGPSSGAFESPFHNSMHSWLGRPMANPNTAAQDPIFWSFHTYIDIIWAQWQQKWGGSPSCLDCPFRGMTDLTMKDVTNTLAMGYTYDILPAPPPAPMGAAGAAPARPKISLLGSPKNLSLPASDVAPRAARAAGRSPWIFDVRIPDSSFGTAFLAIDGLIVPTDFSYGGHVYFYPVDVALAPQSHDFARRYMAGDIGIWQRHPQDKRGGGHDEHSDDTTNVWINVTHDLRYLAKHDPGAKWRVAVVFDRARSADAEEREPAIAPQYGTKLRVGKVTLMLDPDVGSAKKD